MLPFLEEIKGKELEKHPFVDFVKSEILRLQPMFKQSSILPQGMLHSDLFPDNCLFDGEKLIAIVDWEEVSYGPLVLDVAMTVVGFCYGKNNSLDETLLKKFLQSYQLVRPLNSLELALFDDFLDYCLLSIACWRFRFVDYCDKFLRQFLWKTPDPILKNKYLEIAERSKHWATFAKFL